MALDTNVYAIECFDPARLIMRGLDLDRFQPSHEPIREQTRLESQECCLQKVHSELDMEAQIFRLIQSILLELEIRLPTLQYIQMGHPMRKLLSLHIAW
jgi:hypothetical protein